MEKQPSPQLVAFWLKEWNGFNSILLARNLAVREPLQIRKIIYPLMHANLFHTKKALQWILDDVSDEILFKGLCVAAETEV